MTALSELETSITDCFERRRVAITETTRVVATFQNNVLESRVITMAVPMLYAIWEGYTKEILGLYVHYIETQEFPLCNLKPDMLAYAWSSSFNKLKGNLTHDKKVELIERFINSLQDRIMFDPATKKIDTKSNLKFKILENIAVQLCINIDPIRQYKISIDSLVDRRNNIAHGGREQRLTAVDYHQYKDLVLSLIRALESAVLTTIRSSHFLSESLSNE